MKKIIFTLSVLAFAILLPVGASNMAEAQSPGSLCSIYSFTATPSSVTSGSTVKLSWTLDSINCDATVNILGGAWGTPGVRVYPSSITTAPITATTTYTITAYQAGGGAWSTKKTVTVPVVAPTPCKINSFAATPTSVASGGSSSLSWTTSNCTGVTITGGSFSGTQPLTSTGKTTGALTTATTFTLTATGTGGPVTSTATVGINPPCASTSGTAPDLLHGYAWSSTIGWISLNCAEAGSASTDYKVSVNPSTGIFSGYAWSPLIGWISFNAADVTVQCGPVAKINYSTNDVVGWARVLNGSTASGADGCISFNATGGVAYGLSYDPSSTTPIVVGGKTLAGHALTGFAWGDVNTGWINFNYATFDSTYAGGTVDLKANGTDGPVTTADETGGPVTLSWVSTGTTTCSAIPDTVDPLETYWKGTKSTSGTLAIPVPPNTTTSTIAHIYGISCTGVSGTVTDLVEVDVPPAGVTATVIVDVTGAPILSFLVDGATAVTIPSGAPVTLSWTVGSQTSCVGTSSSGTGAYAGWSSSSKVAAPDGVYSEVVSGITTDSTFTMRCTATDGTISTETVTVTIKSGTGTGTGGTRRPPWQEF